MCIAIGCSDDFIREAFIGFREFGELPAHKALHGENGVAGIGDGLALGSLADDALTALGESDHGRGGACTFAIFENDGLAAFKHGHAGVRGSEVNSEDFAHSGWI